MHIFLSMRRSGFWAVACVKESSVVSCAVRHSAKLSKKSPHAWQGHPCIALGRMSLFLCKARSKREAIEMPQLNINIPPELWRALEMQGNEQGDSHAGIVLSALSEYFENSRDRLYQVSTSSALVEGVCEGALDVGTLRKYGDLGIGTFE